ncbi:adenosylhomocysteinase [Patescibacteria group bacterium]|nr:adenosylhomocysteinase [Patescibacteria group bacterium]MBU1702958.1 adenosylhomocysteinase [Patescibacteria group bacterium]MBU1953966.1 adenosylhomocysteinase [Patescibacteria group bacterium]
MNKVIEQGRNNLELAEKNMTALMKLRADFSKRKPFKDVRIGMALHITKETGVLVRTLRDGGAQVAIASCNPLSTQDDVAAALAHEGTAVYGHKGETRKQYYDYLKKVIAFKPNITIDDGCDLVTEIHKNHRSLLKGMIGGCEETTTGIIRLRAMEKAGALMYPIIAVNDNDTKHLMDNYYGTGQSTIDGILRASNVLIAGKTVVVAGYGSCGKGVALRAAGLGARVIVTEVKPFRALQAAMDGFSVMPMRKAAPLGDLFITVTGNCEVLRREHFRVMKSGAILVNSGHFDTEIDLPALGSLAKKRRRVRPFLDEYSLPSGKIVYLVAEGRLANLAAAEGHPSEVMSMSFCGQALAVEYLLKKRGGLAPGVHLLPEEIDLKISRLQLSAMGVSIDKLTEKQNKYLSGWQEGT